MAPKHAETDVRPDKILVEVLDLSHRAVPVMFRIRADTVEVTTGPRACSIFDRDLLRDWLRTRPRLPLVVDDVAFSMDPARDPDRPDARPSISIPGVLVWELSPSDVEHLTSHL